MADTFGAHLIRITSLQAGDRLMILRPGDGASADKQIDIADAIISLPVSIENAQLGSMPPWSFKMRNDPLSGVANDVGVLAFFLDTPISGDFVIGAKSTGEIKRFAVEDLGGGGGGTPNRAYFTYLAAALEPEAIEPPQLGTFSYALGSSDLRMLLASWATQIAGAGRMEVRGPGGHPLFLKNLTLSGTDSRSTAIIVDPSLPTYSDAEATYYSRLNILATTAPKYLALTAAETNFLLLPGPYGSIITHFTFFDLAWITPGFGGSGGIASGNNHSIHMELGDDAGDYMRFGENIFYPLNKHSTTYILTGKAKSGGTPVGAVLYVILPANWSKVADPKTYIFRDDFMGSNLDVSTVWTRFTAGVGAAEIDTNFA